MKDLKQTNYSWISGGWSIRRSPCLAFLLTAAFLSLIPWDGFAQNPPTMRIYGPGHYDVKSYDGLIPDQMHRIHIELQGQGINYQNWSIRAMIVQPLHSQPANVSGLTFPTEKLKFRFIDEQISGNPPQPRPTLENLQVPLTGRPLLPAGAETPLITHAAVPLRTGSSHYVSIDYRFKIDIEGGRYLGDMLSDIGGVEWNMNPAIYRSSIRFFIYNEHQQAIAQFDYPLAIQVHRPLGNPPPDAGSGFNLQLMGGAREGNLTFNALSNYLQGTSVLYHNGVKITAATGYQIQVKSTQNSFLNQQGQGLPLEVLKVQVHPTSGSPVDAIPQPVRLSTVPQTIVTSMTGGNHTHYYDLQYATDAGDPRLPGTRPGRYTAVLLYEITPL